MNNLRIDIPAVREIVGGVGAIIDDLRTTPEEMAQIDIKHRQIDYEHARLEAELRLGQMAINLQEAKSPDRWNSGWRPATGWGILFVIMLATGGQFILEWIWATVAAATGSVAKPPEPMDITFLISILCGLLGMGHQRSQDKRHGVETKRSLPGGFPELPDINIVKRAKKILTKR